MSSNIFYRVLTGMTAALLFEWFQCGSWAWETRVGRERLHSYIHTRLLACTTATAPLNTILIAAFAKSCRCDRACRLEQASSRTAVVTSRIRTTYS